MYFNIGGSIYYWVGAFAVSAFGLALIIDSFLPEGHRFARFEAGRRRWPMSRMSAFSGGAAFMLFGASLGDVAMGNPLSTAVQRTLIGLSVACYLISYYGPKARDRKKLAQKTRTVSRPSKRTREVTTRTEEE